ncbi:hypothetical protein [Pedobacter foliorum]|uniref:hypothetical protein n=1 Tax=Pedobacter foliorum TaxID=2739058 RepID=UPI0015656E6A|nr:hypothetical protein [Pedobacter foliorum]NRF41372.1 hypothetical protein [Pedobacter foliorum]
MRNTILLFCILLFFISCSDSADKKQKNDLTYFDVKGYFEKEAARLTKTNPLINKAVNVNGEGESKSMKIADWKKELMLFSDADINRASWKGLFQLKKSEDLERYTSNNEKVPVKELLVFYKKDKVSGFKFLIKNTNSLYASVDTLTYYPDSLYQIKKMQNIKLLSEKTYTVTGTFK